MTAIERDGLNITEAAAYTGLSVNTVKRLVREGRIPCRQLGGRLTRFSRSGLAAWMLGQEPTAQAAQAAAPASGAGGVRLVPLPDGSHLDRRGLPRMGGGR